MFNKIMAATAAICFCADICAQEQNDTLKGDLDDVVIYANKFPEKRKRIAQSVFVIKDKDRLQFQPNVADVLINSGNVFVQKSQQGGGSPVIRGFEASRVLLMVDGVRMNNAIYRAGHLQNVITVDNNVLDRVEVLYGPSSTLYGSDALGGVVSMYTKDPVLSANGKTHVATNVVARYGTATEEARGHIDVNIGGKQWASFTSVSYASFGDITQGDQRRSAYPSFGKKPFIVKRINNIDSAVVNPDPNKQSPSGYDQVDILQKILFRPTDKISHLLNVQVSNSTDIPRYDRLTEVSGGAPTYAEWYYGPQYRAMVGYQLNVTGQRGFFNDIKLNANYQDIEESRFQRRFRNNRRDERTERVNVLGLNIDAKHTSEKNELQVGAESYTNYVRSSAVGRNIVTGQLTRIATRYADGFNKMSFNAIYAQHTLKINDNWTLNDGLRLNAVRLDARFVDTAIMHFPFTRATQNNLAVTGNIGIVYSQLNHFRLAFLLNSGFRAPNIDDLTKVFDTKAGAVIVPNPDIKPEYTYNAEINFNHRIGGFSYGGSVFYTLFRNAIVVDRFQFNGQDSIVYTGVKSVVLANQNKASAYVTGFSANAKYNFSRSFFVDGTFTYTYGRYKQNNKEVPLDHVPPTYGRAGFTYDIPKVKAELFGLFNGWKKIKDYNPNGEDNQQYATVDGMPSWFTVNAAVTARLFKQLEAQVQVENILDRNYRYFASGVSAPGRNFVLSVRASF